MYKIRKKLFLFWTAVFSVLILAPSLSFVFVGAAGANASVPVIGGEEYKNCFSVNGEGVLTDFTLPAEVNGFYSVALPNTVKTINDGVFERERIKSVVIPASVATIGTGAFSGCTLLSSVKIEDGAVPLTISSNAFAGCWALEGIEIPARCKTIGNGAFGDCGLRWVSLGSADCLNDATVPFGSATVVFSQKADYETALFNKTVSSDNATFMVSVAFYADGETPVFTLSKLYGKEFSFEYTEEGNVWRENSDITDLPAQDESYASTVWYTDKTLKNVTTYAEVNAMLASEGKPAEIKLYAHAAVTPPFLGTAITKVYGKDAYSLENGEQMSALLGIAEGVKTEALVFTAYAEGSESDLGSLNGIGNYLVSVSLKPEYGKWKSDPSVKLELTHDDARTMQLMLITLAVLGLLAVALSISLVLVRVGVAKKKKRRNVSSEEIIDKFIAAGGRTRLKK